MSLTVPPGPLSRQPGPVNFTVDGPAHRLQLVPLGRRVRAELAGTTVLDTDGAALLYETGLRPQLYVPLADVRADLLSTTGTATHCPFKGDASYRTVTVGARVAQDAFWVYDEPLEPAAWLRGLAGCYLDRLDRWLDEDDEVRAFRDPFHRVDVHRSSRPVKVRAGDTVLASSSRALLVSETGVPNRFYLPREDVRVPLEGPTGTTSFCPYKGEAGFFSARLPDGRELSDCAWGYASPFDGATALAGCVSFSGDDVRVLVDGRPAAA